MNTWEEKGPPRIKENCNVFGVTDFFLKSTKREEYRCFNFLFLFVTSYLTYSRILLKITKKKKQNQQKDIKYQSFWISGFLVFS